MFVAKIRVTLRQSILDPQGKAVEHGINVLGYDKVRNVRIGKYIEMHVDVEEKKKAERIADEVCKKLLANPVMEDYSLSIAEVLETKEA